MSMSENTAENLPASPEKVLDADPYKPLRQGLFILLFGFAGSLIWAALAPLDSGVTAPGSVSVDTKHKTIEHLTGGIVQSILVEEGQQVAEGQQLLTLNTSQLEFDLADTESQLATARAAESRLLAERADAKAPEYSHWLFAQYPDRHDVKQAKITQSGLFKSRRSAFEQAQLAYQASMEGLSEQIIGFKALVDSKEKRLKYLNEESESLHKLQEGGYVPRNKVLELDGSLADLEAQKSEDFSNLAKAESALSETRLRKLNNEQEYRKEIDTQLMQVQQQANSLEEKHRSIKDQLDRAVLMAPEAGIVMGLQVHTIGGVIKPGQPVLEIVPLSQTVVIEAQVMPQFIEKVIPGQTALVRFSAFDGLNPVVEGVVEIVSPDRFSEQNTGRSYYMARITVPDTEMKKLQYSKISAGMPVEVVFKTGERSLLNYLLKPLVRRMFKGMKEN